MNVRIENFKFEDQELYRAAFEIRNQVFVNEQQVDPSIECEFEEEAHYYLINVEDTAVGTARWRKTNEGIKLERFAILKENRRQGLGGILLDAILADVFPLNEKIYLHAQKTALDFYLEAGFTVEGEAFEEAGIIHYKMML